MSLKTLVDFCNKYSINMEYVTFWYGHKEVFAIFNKGSIPGIPYPEDATFLDWYAEDESGYALGLPKDDNYYVLYNTEYDCLEARID